MEPADTKSINRIANQIEQQTSQTIKQQSTKQDQNEPRNQVNKLNALKRTSLIRQQIR